MSLRLAMANLHTSRTQRRSEGKGCCLAEFTRVHEGEDAHTEDP